MFTAPGMPGVAHPVLLSLLAGGAEAGVKTPDLLNDFIHVEDVAAGLAVLATSPAAAGMYIWAPASRPASARL